MKLCVAKVFKLWILFCGMLYVPLFAKLETRSGDFTYKFGGSFKPEMLYGHNVALLNSNNEGNDTWFERHTLDLSLGVGYGNQTYNKDVAEFKCTIRNRGIWGNPGSIASTTETEIKDTDAVVGRHSHSIPVHIFWIREAWLWSDLSAFLGLPFLRNHSFKIGFFPFALGRGIALGDAYAVGPELLGFYNDSNVNQFAPGLLIHGDIVEKKLEYDVYAEIAQNRSTGLSETGAAILGQEYGKRETPQRGSGKISFIIASRLMWHVFEHEKYGALHVQPYGLYNRDPEQRVEFLGDATSQLGTLGLAMEYIHPRFELGFDYAFNLGQQRVKGWDRNQVTRINRNGSVVVVNTHVLNQDDERIPFVGGSTAQHIINTSDQDQIRNSQIIGVVDGNVGYLPGPTTLKNGINRFRNPYTNTYDGWMFVIDGCVWAMGRDMMAAVCAGVASGDQNPNETNLDTTYSGFIPLQEAYSGTRVRSAFLLGGAGKLTRPLSRPTNTQLNNRFAVTINGFTNLVFTGVGLNYEPKEVSKKYSINPNILAYWQEKPTNQFDALANRELDIPASAFLGVEVNLFSSYMVFKDLNFYCVGSVFFPGSHYGDIKGKPLSPEQQRRLDRLDRTAFSEDRIPNIGDDTAYTLNIGLEFKF